MNSLYSAGERNESDKTESQRFPDSAAPPRNANEISGGRTNALFPGDETICKVVLT